MIFFRRLVRGSLTFRPFHNHKRLFVLGSALWVAVGLAAPGRIQADGEGTPPREIISFSRGASDAVAVALTFDDGPHPKLTPQLLDILKKENVPATFFMLGEQVEKFPDIAKMVADQGYEIGNHSYTHSKFTKLGRDEIRKEINDTQEIIERATGRHPVLFRAPYGAVNSTVKDELLKADLELTGWAIDPEDWKRGKTSDGIADFIVKHASAGDIILLHDIHSQSVGAVTAVIEGLRAKGLAFTTASDLIDGRREEMKHMKEAPAGVSPSPSDPGVPAAPPLVPLGRSTLKRYEPNGVLSTSGSE